MRIVMVAFLGWLAGAQLARADVNVRTCVPEPGTTDIAYGDLVNCRIDFPGDGDAFRFQGQAGDVIQAYITHGDGGTNPCFRIIEPDGVARPYACVGFAVLGYMASVSLDLKLVKSGLYTIQVIDGDNDQTENYTLVLLRFAPFPSRVTRLEIPAVLTGTINPFGASDLYTFRGRSGDTISISASRTRGIANQCFRLMEPDNAFTPFYCVGFAVIGYMASVTHDFRLTKTGDYLIQFADGDYNETLDYSLDIQCFGECIPIPACPANPVYSLTPPTQVAPSTTGTGAMGVIAPLGCSWLAASDSPFLTISDGAGFGLGTVRYSLTANTSPGSRTATVTVSSAKGTVTQAGSAPLLVLSPSPLAFSVREGSAAIIDQVVSVFTNTASLNFSAAASGGNWLKVSPTSGSAPASIVVSVNPQGLTDGSYQGTITVNAPAANPNSVSVPVRLTVNSAGPPKLGFNSDGLTFSFAQGAAARTLQRTIANAGGATLAFEATARSTPGNWLRVSPDRGQVTLEQQASLAITADPVGLSPGTYVGSIHVAAGGEQRDLPVTMTVSQIRQSILLSQAGLTFIAVASGGPVPSQGVGVPNFGQGLMDWRGSATTLTGGASWLGVSPASGTTDASSLQVPQMDINVNAAGLAAGEYHGQVRVEAQAADNSPQFVSVVLRVLPAGSDPGPLVRPTGLVFTGVAGAAAPGSQNFRILNLTSANKTFASGRLTIDGGSWLAVNPPTGSVTPAQPTTLQVNAASTGLAPGIRRGVLTLLFADGAVRTVNVLFVLSRAGAGNISQHAADGICTPTRLLPLVTSLGGGFTVSAGWPNLLEARVVDDCGNALTTGSVVASFSNGDVPLPLISLKDGGWVRDWTAKYTDVSQVTVTISAEDAARQIVGQAEVSGGLQANPEPTVLASGGVLNAASFQLGGPVSLGGMVSLFGSKLSSGQDKSASLPLQTELAGTLATIGGKVMPLIVATEGQINAVVPYDVPVNTQVPVIVRQGNRYTVPEMVTVAPAQPAVFSADGTGKGQGIIINSEGQLAEPGKGAAAGSAIVIYTTGLGPVAPPVDAGKAAPVSPLSSTSNEVTLTIGGVKAQVLFSGLVPGFTGFYQVNAVVPGNAPSRLAVEVVLTVAGLSSPPVTMTVR